MILKLKKLTKALSYLINSTIVFLISKIDLSDICIVVGLCMLFYGLNILSPWIAYSAVGSIIFLIGISGYIMPMFTVKK